MALRTSVASLLAIVLFFVGLFAISESGQQAEPDLNSTAGNESFQIAEQVFGGVGTAGTGIVWFGIAAVIVVALGLLVAAGRSGGR